MPTATKKAAPRKTTRKATKKAAPRKATRKTTKRTPSKRSAEKFRFNCEVDGCAFGTNGPRQWGEHNRDVHGVDLRTKTRAARATNAAGGATIRRQRAPGTSAVRAYVEWINERAAVADTSRLATAETYKERVRKVEQQMRETASALRRVALLQRRRDLISLLQIVEDAQPLEDAFVAAVGSYSDAVGIEYATWREAGVPASVLERAGFASARRRAHSTSESE